MGWDDLPPGADLKTSSSGWDAAPPSKEEVEGFFTKTAKNIIPDLKSMATNAGAMVKEGAFDMPQRALQTGLELAGGRSYEETPSGKKDTEIVAAAPEQLKEMVRPVTHPIDYLQEHPVQQVLNALGVKEMASGMIPRRAPEIPPVPSVVPEVPIPKTPESFTAVPMRNTPEVPGQPVSRMSPPAAAPMPEGIKTPPPGVDPLQEMKDFIASKTSKVEQKPGWQEKVAKYVKNEVADLRAKDIGMRDPMIRSLDPKRPLQALKKAEDLMGYAAEKGYFKPGLTDVARKDLIESKIAETGKNIGAVRQLGSQRGTTPVAEIRNAIKAELTNEYGTKATREIKTVLADFDRKAKADPSFQGLADLATYLNSEKKTFNKIGQNPGPTTDAANIVSRMNNDALRKVLSPAEDKFYTENLRDFGAHKKLEQMVASAARRGMTGRGAPGGALSSLWQQIWDRGGYRFAGNVADRTSTSVLKNPKAIKTLPEFFEEMAHHASDELDDTLDIKGMAHGGVVPDMDAAISNHLRKEYDKNYAGNC